MGERQRTVLPEDMATTSTAVSTVPQPQQEDSVERVAVITLRPTATRAEARKKVVWTEDTVDNEHMNKKKSKCCCIYEKPRKFDESDSESSDDECEHCYGHVEKKKANRADGQTVAIHDTEECKEPECPVPTATLTLQPPEPAPAPPDKPLPAS